MKKVTSIILLAVALVMGLTQCKKYNEQNITENEGEKVYITLDVNQGSDSRLDVDPPHVNFQNGDKIYVASNGVYVGYLEYNGTNFSGEISNATTGLPLYFYLLGNVTPAETLTSGSTTGCSVVISDQTVNKPVIACNVSNENFGETTAFTSTLRNKCALVKFDITTTSSSAICLIGMNNKVTISFGSTDVAVTQEGEGIIKLTGESGEKWAIMLPQDEKTDVNVVTEDGNYSGTIDILPAISNNAYLSSGISLSLHSCDTPDFYVLYGYVTFNDDNDEYQLLVNGTNKLFSQVTSEDLLSLATTDSERNGYMVLSDKEDFVTKTYGTLKVDYQKEITDESTTAMFFLYRKSGNNTPSLGFLVGTNILGDDLIYNNSIIPGAPNVDRFNTVLVKSDVAIGDALYILKTAYSPGNFAGNSYAINFQKQ